MSIPEVEIAASLRASAERPRRDAAEIRRAVDLIIADGTDYYFKADSPLGEVYVGVSGAGVRTVSVGLSVSDESEFVRQYGERFGRLVVAAEGKVGIRNRVEAALYGERSDIAVDLSDRTPFQRRVLEVVRRIPKGEVRPYGWVAAEAGNARASRAVGTVMARNVVPLLIPCHRVIRNDGQPGNYGYDPLRKVGLLEGEGVPVEEVAAAPYVATSTTSVVCHATCHQARRIKPENRREFKSVARALDAGFRPCRTCRPVAA